MKGFKQWQRSRTAVVAIVKGYQDVFARAIQASRNISWRDKLVRMSMEVVQEPLKHFDRNLVWIQYV
jgi:hypothetical protein